MKITSSPEISRYKELSSGNIASLLKKTFEPGEEMRMPVVIPPSEFPFTRYNVLARGNIVS